MSASTSSGDNGITAQAATAGMMSQHRREEEQPLFGVDGTMISFTAASARPRSAAAGPNGPTRFGPMRIWIQPMNLRSHRVR